MWVTHCLRDTVVGDGDLHVDGGDSLLRANKCFEKGVLFFLICPQVLNGPAGAPRWALENAGGQGRLEVAGTARNGVLGELFKLAGDAGPEKGSRVSDVCDKGQGDFGGRGRERHREGSLKRDWNPDSRTRGESWGYGWVCVGF